MGNSASDCEQFDPCPNGMCNNCNTSIGEQFMPDNFCADTDIFGDAARIKMCELMSSANEWENNGEKEPPEGCCFDQLFPGPAIQCPCGTVGTSVLCGRKLFTGDPVRCCMNDYHCNGEFTGSVTACFSDARQQNTCADGKNGQPNYRDVTSSACKPFVYQYCTGTLPSDDPNSTAWLDRWTANQGGKGSCTNAVIRNLFTKVATPCTLPPPPPVSGLCNIGTDLPIDSEGYFWSANLVEAAIDKYTRQGFRLGTIPGFPGYNPFQDFLYNSICCPYPGLCQAALKRTCAVNTAQRISLNPAVAQWCGCYLPAGEYEDYSVKYNIPPECSPMCNRAGTIPLVGVDAKATICTQNICLIDDITVNLVNTQIGGGIDFNQICANCDLSLIHI